MKFIAISAKTAGIGHYVIFRAGLRSYESIGNIRKRFKIKSKALLTGQSGLREYWPVFFFGAQGVIMVLARFYSRGQFSLPFFILFRFVQTISEARRCLRPGRCNDVASLLKTVLRAT